jgi:hypothetical protein
MKLIGALRVTRAAMHGGFQARVIRLDELAGGTTGFRVLQARNPAIRA